MTAMNGKSVEVGAAAAEPAVEVEGMAQGSAEWHEFRRRYRMASHAPVVMGSVPKNYSVNSADRLRRYNAGEDFSPPDQWTKRMFERAHHAEDAMRERFSESVGAAFVPAVVRRGEYAASLDGYSPLYGAWLEVKMAYSKSSSTWTETFKSARILPHHFHQLVHQAYVVDERAKRCYFIVVCGGEHRAFEFDRSELLGHWGEVERAWRSFADTPADMDPAALSAAKRYAKAYRAHKAAAEDLAAAKTELEAHGGKEYPGVAKVTPYTAAGRVDYRAAAEKHYSAEELDEFRGPPSERFRITIDKGHYDV